VLGGAERARLTLTEIANEPGVPPDLAVWLATGKEQDPSLAPASESLADLDQKAHENRVIAEILRISGATRRASGHIAVDVLAELEILAPQLVAPVRSLAVRSEDLTSAIVSLAERRGLALRGLTGDTVEFSPLEHDLPGQSSVGVRWVRVVQPCVEMTIEGQQGRRIILKALVEPAAPPM
jgi:hypothetical protein